VFGYREIQCGGAGDHAIGLDLDRREAARELDGDAEQAAVADDDVGACADDVHRHVAGQRSEERCEVVGIRRADQHFGGAADAEPREGRKGRVVLDAAAQGGNMRERGVCCTLTFPSLRDGRLPLLLCGRGGHGAPPAARRGGAAAACSSVSSAGSAAAHCVIEPAPRHTTKSPDRAIAFTISDNRAGEGSATTERWPRARSPSTSASRFTPSIGASPAGYTSATITVPASFMQVQNSSNSEWRREKRCGCTTAITSRAPACRAAFSTAAISTGWWP